MSKQLEEQIIDLQSRVAFQEEHIRDLRETLTEQQLQMETLKREMAVLIITLRQMESEGGGDSSGGHEVPPHY